MDNKFKLNIGIRADGDNSIGLGHIVRTMALAKEFQKRNHKVTYWTKRNAAVLNLLKQQNFNVIELDSSLDIEDEIEFINHSAKQNEIDIFIGDSKDINDAYVYNLERDDRLVVLIDVLRDMSLDADLIINGGIYAIDYEKEARKHSRSVALGTQYNLLREQFKNCKKRVINKNAENILITMGGSDNLNLTTTFIEYINGINNKLNINVVLGAAFVDRKEIEREFGELQNVCLNYDVKDMSRLMYENDIAVSSGGTTLYELSATGTPTMSVIQADNQILQTSKFHEKGIIDNLGEGHKLNEEDFVSQFELLLEDFNRRKSMSRIGQKEVDGKGAERCYYRILEEYFSRFKTK